MIEYFPVLVSLLFVVVAFIYATHKGVVSLLASGLAIGLGVALILAGCHWLPGLAKTYLDIDLTWQFTLGLSAGIGGMVFLVVRIILAFALKRIFNSDGPFHRFVDGNAGGVLSLFPSFVAVFLFFTCVRAAGTVQELNYIDSLSQPGIERMGGKIPAPPSSILWRNGVESLPFLAVLLDRTDPFSRRRARNAAAFTLIGRSVELRNHLLGQPDFAGLLESEQWKLLAADPDVEKALGIRDRVALVTAPAVRKAANDFEDGARLEGVVFLAALREFTHSLEPVAEPEVESF